MLSVAGRVLASALAVLMALGILFKVAPISTWQALLACVGWGLAYFGDDLAPVIGLQTSPSTSRYIEPVVRGIGWLFLVSAFGLYCARVFRLW